MIVPCAIELVGRVGKPQTFESEFKVLHRAPAMRRAAETSMHPLLHSHGTDRDFDHLDLVDEKLY